MTAAMPLAVCASDLVFRYYEQGKRNILDHAGLKIPQGKITVLTGSSGCGKSTLGLVLGGLLPENGGVLESGSVSLFGTPLESLSPARRAGLFGMMFQNPDLQYCMDTLRREMLFCLENLQIPPEEMDERVRRTAAFFHMEKLLDRKLQTLSGGEKQKGILACLYAMESRCLFLDEPFANLDPASAGEILESLQALRDQGRTVLVIDHRLDYWLDCADEFQILGEGGRVLAQGITRDNLAEYRPLFLQEGIFYPEEKTPDTGRRRGVSPAANDLRADADDSRCAAKASGTAADGSRCAVKASGMASHASERPSDSSGAAVSSLAVDIRALARPGSVKKRLFRKPALEDGELLLADTRVSFAPGTITAILGSSGSGKTTFFLALLKQCPFSGEIRVEGKSLAEYRPKDLYAKVGIVFQNPANQFITQQVEEEILTSIRIWNPGLSQEALKEKAEAMLDLYGLKRYRNYSPYMLSQGQQRRLAVLSVLAGQQRILLLDEPTYGQDYRSSQAMMSQIREKAEKEKLTVLFTTHDEALAGQWSQRRLYLRNRRFRTEEEVHGNH